MRIILLIAATLGPWIPVARGDDPAPPAQEKPRMFQVTDDGAWCWFADPRALRHGNVTFIGYVTSAGDIRVSAWNHAAGRLADATLHPRLQADDHANPALLLRPDGRLTVFYSAHNGRQMFFRTTTQPDNVSAWSDEREVKTNSAGSMGFTYPSPVQLADENGRIYLLWRGGDWNPTYATSDDGGATWAEARRLIAAAGHRPYFKVASDGRGTIHIAYTDGHPHPLPHNSIHYLCYRKGSLWKADGTRIAGLADMPVAVGDGDTIYDASAKDAVGRGWIWDIAIDKAGRPVLVYATIPDQTGPHRYHYARFDGRAWVRHDVIEAGASIDGPREWCYSGGMSLDPANPGVLFLSRQVKGVHEIERWETADGGATWKSEAITSDSRPDSEKNVRPFVVRGHGDEMQVLWMRGRYVYWTDYHTSLMAWPPPKK
ncbi:MAG: hypothetical protein BIFFINMI_02887 [Phycisphaerae bacterium]|nr:hypothetical protein [Phycisphaerae bacterium]